MEKLCAYYYNIFLKVESEIKIKRSEIHPIINKYLPGICFVEDKKHYSSSNGQVKIVINKCSSKRHQYGFCDVKSPSKVNIIVKSTRAYPYFILGSWKIALILYFKI